jgi:hypothetical protein
MADRHTMIATTGRRARTTHSFARRVRGIGRARDAMRERTRERSPWERLSSIGPRPRAATVVNAGATAGGQKCRLSHLRRCITLPTS